MGIFKLKKEGDDLSKAELVEASKTTIDLEKHLEGWIENSPAALCEEPFIWIGRQATAASESTVVFPDLLGIDKDGNLVIVEFKKGKTPREVVAQLLEYATWGNELSDDSVRNIAENYFINTNKTEQKTLEDEFKEIFEAEEIPSFNQRQRLFIVAEEILPSVSRVCRFLRMSHGIDINCIQFSIFETGSGEILVNSQTIVGQEDVVPPKKSLKDRWAGEKPVKQVVWEAIQEITKGKKSYVFSPKEISDAILKIYPSFNKSSIRCQIISDCVGHSSRHHYPGGEDRYWYVEKGKYRLFDPANDKIIPSPTKS